MKAKCHPSRKARTKGMCNACYLRTNGGSKKWYIRNRRLTIRRSTKWNKENSERHSEIQRNSQRRQRTQVKLEVLAHYGKDGKLLCCWRNCRVLDVDLLTLDHINNDGAGSRRRGTSFYFKLRKEDFPRGFQTLCWNHQWKKEISRRRGNRK